MHSPVLAIRRTPLVAVYGTLKRGLRNHHWLEGATFVGADTLGDITLYDLGHCPGAKREPSRGIEVELYRVDARGLRHLDRLEDYRVRAPLTGTYDRVLHDTAFGPAWLYLYNPEVSGCPVIRTGGWPVS
ncbi:gamma-glutamylcyclotransferase (GGCT)/AIG2-like uncharacterized protein YtfP [Chromohalobacter marismortui]|uniref:Gamma-glutamylcyclotransferase (GGCT)/AIG2-like uncharacterized protein YtfP n=1 Tax=Chromohalobacter marismortui TaxID=42055 RepID=A0A4V3F408_9GAMM|nr:MULTISPECIES: gamma-glutamylcyclotransferase family protein [Chromohalobacter]MCI0508457.1 gamma-glutamylcyclotransferase [Chromohalobacter sp.]MCI0594656.1 gamma-glutamylcyclotransferase [Chromohalobacter sp.]TDU22936.1 gamma-glutamylcyclotransferase (GGCT)/AIG2-like uncharacterized protein YtfP [Chromohalobacter marismortui]